MLKQYAPFQTLAAIAYDVRPLNSPPLQVAPVVPADPESIKKDKWDYSKHHLQYTAAAPAHQASTVSRTQLLERPAPVADDEDEGKPKELAPITMKILDENMPSVHVPNTLNEPRVKFHNGFPAVGAYCASAAKQTTGQFSCILAADTLVPHGDGQPFCRDDRDFVWDLSLVVSQRLERYAAARIGARLQLCMTPTIEEMKESLKAIRKAPTKPESNGDTAAEGEPAPAEEGAEEAAAAEEEAPPPAEEEEELSELDPEADPAAQVEHYTKVVRNSIMLSVTAERSGKLDDIKVDTSFMVLGGKA